MVEKNASTPLYLQIQKLLLDQIQSGVLKPGDQVLSEPEIAAQYGVSRMTARKALDALVVKGVLYRRQGKGTYVAASPMSYGLSTMLSFSRTFRMRGHDVVTQVLTKDVIPGTEPVLDRLELPANSQLILIRRLRLIDDQPAAIHISYLEYARFAPVLQIDLSQESLLDVIENVSGLRVAYTEDSVQADVATVEERLLGIDVGAPVLRIEGVAYTDTGFPMRFTRAVYRGDMFRFVVRNIAEQETALKIARG